MGRGRLSPPGVITVSVGEGALLELGEGSDDRADTEESSVNARIALLIRKQVDLFCTISTQNNKIKQHTKIVSLHITRHLSQFIHVDTQSI